MTKNISSWAYWKKMKEKVKKEYLKRVAPILSPNAVPKIRYGAGAMQWTNEELEYLDRNTRKLKTMH